MEDKSKKSSSAIVEIDNTLGVETENKGLDTVSNEQNKVSTTSHFSEAQQNDVKKILKNELDTATIDLKGEIKKEGEELKKDFIIIFGLFASFASFLSIEVQIFKTKETVFELVGITSLTVAFVLFFAITISDISKSKNSLREFFKPLYFIIIMFIGSGIYFLKAGGTEEQFKNKVSKKQYNDSLIIENLKNKLKVLDIKIQQMDSTILLNNQHHTNPAH